MCRKKLDCRGSIEFIVTELATRMVGLGYQVTCYNRRSHHVSVKEFYIKRKNDYERVIIKTVPIIDKKGLSAMTSSFFCVFGKYDVVHFYTEGLHAML